MAKEALKKKFATGEKPSGDDFAELIETSQQDLSEFYTKSEVDSELSKKASSSALTKKADKTALDNKADKKTIEDIIARLEELENPAE